MSNTPLHDRPSLQTSIGTLSSAAPRRLLICGGAEASAFVAQGFARTDYTAQTATLDSAADFAARLAPEIVMIELSADGTEAGLTLARRLRGDAATFNVPLILLHQRDDPATRRAALALGADDYFAITASRAEMLARLDALVWRTAVGRRTAPTAPDQQAEIDDFLVFVDHLRDDIKAGAAGTLALIEMQADKSPPPFEATNGDAPPHTDNSNAKAFGFFKLRLRRIDALVFYGPTTLLIHLPQLDAARASIDLARLCDDFCRNEPAARLLLGVAAFPADGTEIEELIERAEARLGTPHAAGFAASSSNGNNSNGNSAHANGAHPHNRRKTDLIAAAAQHTSTLPTIAPHSDAATDQTSAPHKAASTHDAARMSRDREAFSRAAAAAAEEECALRARGVDMPQRILIAVSDPARLAQLNSLVRSAGYEVRTAFAGQQALDLIRIERFDVLLVDHELYGLDGIETIRRLRRQERGRPALPVVLILEEDRAEPRQDARALGVGGIVTLPYQPSDLLRSLRTARLAQPG